MASHFNKKDLSERDICTKFILPALVEKAGWDRDTQIREELPVTAGRMINRGTMTKRGKPRRADFVLYHKLNLPIAVIEAKENNQSLGAGMAQALAYAEMLDVPFAYSSNGDGFIEHDRTGQAERPEREIALDAFPSPAELWARYRRWKGITETLAPLIEQEYYPDPQGKLPRYYQVRAINRVVEAIGKGQQRILLVMATGTGKTFTAFQIIWRLWRAGLKKRILFLADRNILVDQARQNDFKPFGDKMTKITNRKVDKSYEVYLALYQAISGSEVDQNVFKQFSPEFFDLIVVDECHRGSASVNSAWRQILDYFSGATQIGLTATPKETADISTTDYFGDPVDVYSLKQGIEDGYLAPYRVIRYDLDKDLGWEPEQGKRDKHGQEIEQRIYNIKDHDRNMVLERRTALVAQKVSEFLKATDRYAKTIVFCEDIDHAERMRSALVNENPDLAASNRRYVVRITGDTSEGKAELDPFIDPESKFPVIATTSKLLTTGVDAQTCKVIVLDQSIESISEFKQIIGRGTRLREDLGKRYFTIIDFRNATRHFFDEEFDGLPERIYEPKPGDPSAPPEPPPGEAEDTEEEKPDKPRWRKYVVDDVPVYIVMERVQYYGRDGSLITESLKAYTRALLRKEFSSLDAFLRRWSEVEQKAAVVEQLEEHGIFFEELAREVGGEYSPFDLVCHIAFDKPPMTRKERAGKVRKKQSYFAKYGAEARAVLEALLDKYADEGVEDLHDPNVLKVQPLSTLGTPMELLKRFGGREGFVKAVRSLEDEIYEAS